MKNQVQSIFSFQFNCLILFSGLYFLWLKYLHGKADFFLLLHVVRIGVIYLVSGFGGSVLSSLFIQNNISVGASGSLFGLLGAMLSELFTNWTIYTNKVRDFSPDSQMHCLLHNKPNIVSLTLFRFDLLIYLVLFTSIGHGISHTSGYYCY